MKAQKQKSQRVVAGRYPSLASRREWGVFLLIGVVACASIAFEVVRHQERQREERDEAQKLARWQDVARKREKALRRMESDKGRAIEIRKRGGLKPGERLLSLPAASDEPPPSSARSGR